MLKEQQKGNEDQNEQMNDQMANMRANQPKMPKMGDMKMPKITMPKL